MFDVNNAYIMAESTQTLSLEDDSTHDPGDQLWSKWPILSSHSNTCIDKQSFILISFLQGLGILAKADSPTVGHSVIPRDVACCEVTVNFPSFDAAADHRESVFIVDDLTQHPELKSRPYVAEFPHGRWYAGVPITTPKGVKIGAYCILDDKPREGISERNLTFMRDMSQTVMSHLETIRALSEREQNNQMVAGLGDFVRNAPGSQNRSSEQHEALVATNMTLDHKSNYHNISRKVVHSIPEALVDKARAASPSAKSQDPSQPSYFDRSALQEQQSPQSSPSGALSPMPKYEP